MISCLNSINLTNKGDFGRFFYVQSFSGCFKIRDEELNIITAVDFCKHAAYCNCRCCNATKKATFWTDLIGT